MRAYTGLLGPYLALRPEQMKIAECFTFTLANGNQYRYTNTDTDVSFYYYDTTNIDSGALGLGNLGSMVLGAAREAPIATFKSNSVRVDGLKFQSKIGVDVDEQDITVAYLAPPTFAQSGSAGASGVLGSGDLGSMVLAGGPYSSPGYGASQELVEGVPFALALAQGVFDYATLQRDRAYLYDWGAPPIGTVTLFYGLISEIEKVGRSQAQIKVKSYLVRLDTDYPRRLYGASCPWVLYGAGCELTKASFAVSGAVGAGSTNAAINWSNTAGIPQGTITFTSGVLDNVSATVKSVSNTSLTLAEPLLIAPQAGDTFSFYPSCDHTTGAAGCSYFNNLNHFGGFPDVPPPASAL